MHIGLKELCAVAAFVVFVIDAWWHKSLPSAGLALLTLALLFT
mgnify:CR=1 FL=1